jgi:hypothetical protein
MCDLCSKARTLPLQQAFAFIATAMQQRKNASSRACLDQLVGELAGIDSDGEDAMDCELQPLKDTK